MASQQGGGGQADNSMGTLWIMIALVIAIAIIWFAFHAFIVAVIFQVKLWEMAIIGIFTDNLNGLRESIRVIPTQDATLQQVSIVANEVGRYLRIPAVLMLGVLAALLFRVSSAGSYRKIHNMETLLKSEKANWPQIRPVAGINLVKEDIEKGPWAMAMTPTDFCKKKGLIIEEMQEARKGELQKTKKLVAKLDKGLANSVFIIQLGSVWQGWRKLPPYARAIFGVFAATASGEREVANDLLWHMADKFNCKKNTTDYTGGDALCEKYGNSKLVQRVVNSHGYIYTVMSSMFELARCDGVFASSDFLWLKTIDRRLWYVLNTVGRVTPFVEVAGIYAHWLIEKELERKIMVPKIDEATKGLELSLQELIYQPDEE